MEQSQHGDGGRVSRVAEQFRRLAEIATRAAPQLRIDLAVGDLSEFPAYRDFAYCTDNTDPIRIVVSPRLENQRAERIDGILRHELGHAVYMLGGDRTHSEREADKMAERLFGGIIRYDEFDVQTTGHGITPRPRRLG